jgi:hypothetical protein
VKNEERYVAAMNDQQEDALRAYDIILVLCAFVTKNSAFFFVVMLLCENQLVFNNWLANKHIKPMSTSMREVWRRNVILNAHHREM